MSAAAGEKPVRKFPPPCWTRDEALVLIEAYRERWYALHRAFLRTPDWDAVAEKVTTSCPDVTPPKTSAQCRHKMEKLRQRHRAEKQRASAFSGERFFSSWFYFEAMEAMENGYDTEPGNLQIDSEIHNPKSLNPGRGLRFKPSAVQNLVTLATSSTKHNMKSSPNFGPKVSNRYSSYPNNGSNQEDEDEDGGLVETPIEETIYKGHKFLAEAPIREAKNHRSSSIGGGTRNKPLITPQPESGRSGLRPRKFSKVVVHDDEDANNGGMWVKVPRNPTMFRGRSQNANGKESNKGKKNKGGLSEVVSSIKLLGDGFLKMEKMKIDMAREMEKMRMESEMKRNELILESQKQIVDAFVKGVIESRKQQPTTMAHL
ncbi:unnamed protein product [Lactuca virosa]|uniref:Myb-like domain-containing protein n=1 Tax=Lactuca virosa TaxID=75947 RepID=A0AAU9PTW4_9ASTR|nr:unnamed protein product [Lactuca virosa]